MKKRAGWLVLALIAVVAGALLATVNRITEEPIRRQDLMRTQGSLAELFPEADEFEEIPVSVGDQLLAAHTALKAGQPVGYAATVASQGYAGPVEVVVGLEPSLVLRGIRVGGSSFQETEGLGSRVKEEAFTGQFAGKTPPLALGQEIEAVAGATVSSSAVVEGVNDAAAWAKGHLGGAGSENQASAIQSQAPSATRSPVAATGLRTANASVIGYAGPVLVRLSLAADNTIAALTIGGVRMQETPGLGARVAEPEFANRFIGLTPPVEAGSVELIAGATVSSLAVVEAINQAAAFLQQAEK